MPSLATETPIEDLAHILQYAQLASRLVCQTFVLPTKRCVTLTITARHELLDFLRGIEARAQAATAKLSRAAVPTAYLTGDLPSKLLRFYDCEHCAKPHWEDERALFDAHVGYRAKQGFQFGHRTALGLVR